MDNQIKGDIVIRGADKASKDLKDVGKSAATAATQVEDLGKDSQGTSTKVDGLTKSTKGSSESLADMAKEAGFLDREVSRLQGSISALTRQLNETGDTSLLKDIRKEKRQLGTFSKLAASLGDTAEVAKPAADAGMSFGAKFTEAAGAAVKAGGPYVMGGLALAAAAAVPYIGAVIGAAVLGGAGAGGLIGGLTLAAQDPRVKAGGEAFATSALGDLKNNIGKSFVEPAISALGVLGSTVSSISQQAAPGFAILAKEIKPLAEGISGLARNAMPGFLKGIEAAGPILRTVSNHLPKIGSSLGYMFEEIASGGEGATQALDLTLTKVERLIEGTGELIGFLGRSYETVSGWAATWTGGLEDVYDKLGYISPVYNHLSDKAAAANDDLEGTSMVMMKINKTGPDTARVLWGVGESAEKAAEESATLNDAIGTLFGTLMSADQAALAAQEGLRTLREELGENKKTLKLNTEAGDENRGMILDQIEAYEQLRAKNVEAGMATGDANKLYESQVGALRNMLVQLGFVPAAVDEIINRFKMIPTRITTQLFVDDAQAWSRIRAIERRAEEASNGAPPIERRASGGPTKAGRTYLVGENGPELWSETSNGHVTNAAQTAAMMSGTSGGSAVGGGGSAPHYTLGIAQNLDALGAALVTFILPHLTIEVGKQGGSISRIVDSRI